MLWLLKVAVAQCVLKLSYNQHSGLWDQLEVWELISPPRALWAVCRRQDPLVSSILSGRQHN